LKGRAPVIALKKRVALPAPVRTQASIGQNASAVSSKKNLDEIGKNKAAKPSPDDPRSMLLITPGKLAPNPDTQNRATSGKDLILEKNCLIS
jgi:hypothetical protein